MTEVGLALLCGLTVKHFLCDFVFQTPYQLDNKRRYGHPGGLIHAGIHAAATLALLLAFKVRPELALGLSAAEFALHYHLDWAKEVAAARFVARGRAAFWNLIGFDQMLHHLTYLAIVAIVA